MQAAYYALHYGADYLAWSVRSIQDAVDEIHIFYVAEPSYGHTQGLAVPDTRDALLEQSLRFANKPVIWHDCPRFGGEHQHRDHAVSVLRARGADQILVVDADEVWPVGHAKKAMFEATHKNAARSWTAPFVHFYRSLRYAVRDHFLPVRILDLRHESGTGHMSHGPVLHFGYAQRTELVRYKWTCHGHQSELRKGWIDRFLAWTRDSTDLHPVVIGLWPKAERVEAPLDDVLHDSLPGHPYWAVDVIG